MKQLFRFTASEKKELRFLGLYLVIFYLLAGIGFITLKAYAKSHFTPAKLEQMITTQSSLRDTTTDVCKYPIYGDPVAAGNEYVKINFFCLDKKSLSTLSLKAVSDRSFAGVIKEMAYITGFDPNLLLASGSSWHCQINQKDVTDQSLPVDNKAVINCTQK